MTIALHIALAIFLFLSINWIGRHAIDFGYSSSNLFETPTESIALNFLVRVLAPTVFIVVLSALCVYVGQAHLRLDIYLVVIYYYAIRAIVIIAIDRSILVNWVRYTFQSIFGVCLSYWAYLQLILPNRSLLPNVETMGNELWLAIFAFLYALGNKVELPEDAIEKRKQNYITESYQKIREKFQDIIEIEAHDPPLQLMIYGVLIYENYCRPPFIRGLERISFWKSNRSTGIMQVKSDRVLSDLESVKAGIKILSDAWRENEDELSGGRRVSATIGAFNRDQDYIDYVYDVMFLMAKRSDRRFEAVYQDMLELD